MAPRRKPKSAKSAKSSARSRKQPSFAEIIATLNQYIPLSWVRTGIPTIDLIIGAGIPRGRLIEVIGDPGTVKTGFGLQVAAAFQKVGGQSVFIDAEAKATREFADRFGVDWDRLAYQHGGDLAEIVRLIGRVARTAKPKVPTLILWDSLAATPGVDEFEEMTSEKGMQSEKAARARVLSAAWRAVMNTVAKNQVTVVVINQLRTKFNFMSGYTSLDSPGGRGTKYHAALRLHFRPKGRIRDRERDVVTGMLVEIEAVKNNVGVPFRKATLQFKFDTGFEPYSGLDELLLRHGRLRLAGGWLDFRGKKFRAAAMEQMAAEMPDLLEPLNGTIEKAKVRDE